MQETKQRKIKNMRKFLLYILLAVVLPLAILMATAIAFNIEGRKFKIKVNNIEKTYETSDFDGINTYRGIFEKLEINKPKYKTTYKNKSDEDHKYNPQGYEISFELEAKLKNTNDIYNLSDGIQCYAVVSLPGYKKNGLVVDRNVKISKDSTTASFSTMKITKPLPHFYPFMLPFRSVVVYFILRVPYAKQDALKLEEQKRGKTLSGDDKEKFTDYKEFKFYWDFTKNTPEGDKTTGVR